MTQGEEAAGSRPDLILPKITFNAGLAGTLFYFLDNRPPSNVEFDTAASMSVLPERPFGLDVGIGFSRLTRPFTAYSGSRSANFYAEDRILPSATLRAQSRSGVLRGSLSYAPGFRFFENDAFAYLNTITQEVTGLAAWKFLPHTALVYEGTASFTRYNDLNDPFAVVTISDSNRFMSRLGINGAITPHFSARVLAGYAVGFYENRALNDFEDVIGEAAIAYKVDVHSFELGYGRTVSPSAIGGWMQEDRGFLQASTLLARVFAVTLRGLAGRAHYGRVLDSSGLPLGIDADTGLATSKRDDTRVEGGLHAEYRVTNWLAILADLSVLATLTDFRFRVDAPTPYPAQFVSYQGFGGLRVHY